MKALWRYIEGWEYATGVRSELAGVAQHFALREGLDEAWTALPRRSVSDVRQADFALLYAPSSTYRGEMALEERIAQGLAGVLERCGPDFSRHAADIALTQLSWEVGYPISERPALAMAQRWLAHTSAQRPWAIEIAPAVGDEGEAMGFCVLGLLYTDTTQTNASIYDLEEPLPYEANARRVAAFHRLLLGAISPIAWSDATVPSTTFAMVENRLVLPPPGSLLTLRMRR